MAGLRSWYCLAGLLIGQSLFAQSFFNIYGSNAAEHGQCVAATPDGNIVVGGVKNDSALVIKVDLAGNLIWTRCFKPVTGANNFIHHITATPDGYLIGVGNAVVGNDLRGKTFLFKMDVDGNLIWQTASTDPRDQWSHRILPMNNGEYMLFSGIWDFSRPTWADMYTNQVDPNTGLPGPDPLFIDVHPTTPYCEEIHGACIAASGTMYATGRVYLKGSANDGMRAFLTRYSPTGEHDWTKYLMFPIQQNARIYGADIAHTGDSLILGYYGDINGASSQYSVGLVRTDTLGLMAWSKDYRISGPHAMMAYSVVVMPYGYVLTGDYGTGVNRRLFAIATDGQGNLLWAKSFGTSAAPLSLEKWHSFQAIGVGNDVFLAGTRNGTGATNKDVVLIRLAPNGDDGCAFGVSIMDDLTVTNVPPFTGTTTPDELVDQVSFVTKPPLPTASAIQPCPYQLDLGPDQALCNGSIGLQAPTGADTYNWSNGSGNSFVAVTDPGIYWVDVQFGCCMLTDTVEIFPSTAPVASFEAPQVTCDALSVSFTNTSTAGTFFLWDFGDGTTSTAGSPVHVYGQPGTYSVNLMATNNCGSDQFVMDVVVGSDTGSDIAIDGPGALCGGTNGTYTVELDGIDVVSILWSTGETTPTIEVTADGTQVLQVEVTDAGGCEYTGEISIDEVAGPTAAFDLDPNSCELTIGPLNTSSNADGYSWGFGDGNTSSDEEVTHVYAAPGIYTITLTATSSCGSDVATSVIELFPTGVFTITGPDALCQGEAGTYVAVLDGATLDEILWTNGDDTGEILFATNTPTLLGATATDVNGCLYNGEITISVDPLPVAGFSFNALDCDTEVTFQDASMNAESWSWDLGNGQTSTASSPTGTYTGSGIFQIRQVAGNACGTDTVIHQLILGPTGTLSLSGPGTLCQDEPGTYTALLDGATLASVGWSTGQVGSTVEVAFGSNGTLSANATDDQGCSYSAMLSVQVIPGPEAGFTSENDPCDDRVVLYDQSAGTTSFTWFFSNGTTSQLPSPMIHLADGEMLDVLLVVTNACGSDSITGMVMGTAPPTLEVVGPERICNDTPFNLGLSHPSGLSAIEWSTGDTTMVITALPGEGGTITVTAVNDHGCSLSASYTLYLSGDGGRSNVYIPNVFTPDNDGINDTFAPVIQEGFLGLMIFNRWGQLIFETDDPGKGWHGEHKGQPVPDGIYVYLVRWYDACDMQNREQYGHVTVLR